MIVEKRNSILVILLMFCISNAFAQLQGECHVTDTLISKIATLNLPVKYKKNVTRYDEGIFVDYLFQDGVRITLFQGALQRLPLLPKEQGYVPLRTDTIKNRIIHIGVMDDKSWREDQLEDVRLYYDKVPSDNQKMYDRILDSIFILPYSISK